MMKERVCLKGMVGRLNILGSEILGEHFH